MTDGSRCLRLRTVPHPHNPAYTRPLFYFEMEAKDYRNAEWWTAPAEADDGRLIMVSGCADVQKFRSNPRFHIRFTITWKYSDSPDANMPDDSTAELMEKVTEALEMEFAKDPVAVMTGIYTGAGERNWVFYTLSTHIFARKLNECLAELPLLPLELSAEEDPDWCEYDEMSQLSIL